MWEQALRRLGALSVTLNPIHGNKHTDREAGVGGTRRFITYQYDTLGGGGGGVHTWLSCLQRREIKKNPSSFMRKA